MSGAYLDTHPAIHSHTQTASPADSHNYFDLKKQGSPPAPDYAFPSRHIPLLLISLAKLDPIGS